MRPTRRFRPVLDSLQDRIAPSAIALAASDTPTAAASGPVVTPMDDTGSPGEPSDGNWYMIILANPPGTTSSTGTSVC